MTEITSSSYWAKVDSLADSIIAEAMAENDNDREAAEEEIKDSRLHEVIDGHEWIIYYSYNLPVIQFSGNPDYAIENFGEDSAVEALRDRGIKGLYQHIAYWALYADVQDMISDKLGAYVAIKED